MDVNIIKQALTQYKQLIKSLDCECDAYHGFTCELHKYRAICELALNEIGMKKKQPSDESGRCDLCGAVLPKRNAPSHDLYCTTCGARYGIREKQHFDPSEYDMNTDNPACKVCGGDFGQDCFGHKGQPMMNDIIQYKVRIDLKLDVDVIKVSDSNNKLDEIANDKLFGYYLETEVHDAWIKDGNSLTFEYFAVRYVIEQRMKIKDVK